MNRQRRADGIRTRARLISAAERLYAEGGINSVSLSEINRVAGQANKSALHYHFGSRDGLLIALVDKHRSEVDARRATMLEHYDPQAELTLEEAVGLMVRPLADKTFDLTDGGVHYIRIMAQLAAAPHDPVSRWMASEPPPAYSVLAPILYGSIPLESPALRVRRALLMNGTLFHALNLRTWDTGGLDVDGDGDLNSLFIEDLVSCICGLLSAPVSTPTSAGR